MHKKYMIFPDGVISTVLLLLCVKHHAHRNSKSRVYSGLPTRSYTAAAAGVALRCCCCCGLGARTHAKPAPDLSVDGIHTTSKDTHSRLRRPVLQPSHIECTISV